MVITSRFDFVLHILVFTVLLCALVRAGAKGVANYNVIVSHCLKESTDFQGLRGTGSKVPRHGASSLGKERRRTVGAAVGLGVGGSSAARQMVRVPN